MDFRLESTILLPIDRRHLGDAFYLNTFLFYLTIMNTSLILDFKSSE